MRLIVLLLILGFGGWWAMYEPETLRAPGMTVSGMPAIWPEHIPPWTKGDYSINALDAYAVRARVLSKSHYFFDRESRLAPYDLALGWQEMSDTTVIDALGISQSDRFYFYHWNGNPPIAPNAIAYLSGNMHIVPGNDDVLATLRRVHKGDIIRLQGHLIEIHGKDNWTWVSATNQYSAGKGGCKVIWVTSLTIDP